MRIWIRTIIVGFVLTALAAISTGGVNVWTQGNLPYRGQFVITDSQVPGTIYGGTMSGIAYVSPISSSDFGATWQQMSLEVENPRPLATAPPATVYVAGDFSGEATVNETVFVSTNRGGVWTALVGGPNGGTYTTFGLVVDFFQPSTLYLSENFQAPIGQGGSGLRKSTDAGATWTLIDAGLGLDTHFVTALVAAATVSGTLYVATGPLPSPPTSPGGLFKSADAGSTWVQVSSLPIAALAVDPTNPAILYASNDQGVFKSVDGGVTFVASNTGLTFPDVRSLCIDPVHPNRLYAGTSGSGVFASQDAGATWQAMNAGLGDNSVTSLAIDATGTHLHAGTAGAGIYDFTFAAESGVLSLFPGRSFSVSLTATDQRTGREGPGVAIPASSIFGYFSIPAITGNPGNPEVFVKMLDGTGINGKYWFFYGGLTDLEYTLTVTDNGTGEQKTYNKASGSECGGSDTAAFPQ